MYPVGLGDKYSGNGFIQCGSIHIDGRSQGQDEADRALVHAGFRGTLHGQRQGSRGTGRAEGRYQRP